MQIGRRRRLRCRASFSIDGWMGAIEKVKKKQFGASQIRQQVAGDHAEFHSKMITG